MALTFPTDPTYAISYGAQKQTKPRVKSVQFNDGYELRIGDGLNTVVDRWTVSWNAVPTAAADQIEIWFRNHGGRLWFWWTPPREKKPIKVVCKEWTRGPVEGSRTHDTISATFTQVFDLQG